MPFFAAIDRPTACIFAPASATDYAQALPFRRYFQTDAVRSTLNEIRVAGVVYPLRQPCATDFIPVIGEFLVDGFSPLFVGHGATTAEAQREWALAVHAAFQELQHRRPFEMSDEDRNIWSTLASRIDVTVFRNQTPIQVRQFGRIERARPYPDMIAWENGSADLVALNQVNSAEFITFRPGQPIEAVVARDPVTFQLVRILYIQKRSSATRLPSREEAELLEAIRSTKTLPAAGWD